MDQAEKFLSWNQEMEAMKKLTIPQIKDILHKHNLKKTGNKTTLIQRAVTFIEWEFLSSISVVVEITSPVQAEAYLAR